MTVDTTAASLREMGYQLLALAEAEDARTEAKELQRRSLEPPNRTRQCPPLRIIDPAALVDLAKQTYEQRRKRERFLDAGLFGEPFWDILLDLYVRDHERNLTSVTSVCVASCVPPTTALRHISILEEMGMLERFRSGSDARVNYLRLSIRAKEQIGDYLLQSFQSRMLWAGRSPTIIIDSGQSVAG